MRACYHDAKPMYLAVRVSLVLLALLPASFALFFSYRLAAASQTVLRSWIKTNAKVVWIYGSEKVELEIAGDPEPQRVAVPVTHTWGLSLLKKVSVYQNPGNPQQIQLGGFLQMWLWPSVLALASVLLLSIGIVAARAGTNSSGAGWSLSAPPPPINTEIRVHPPASEWKAPLFWSLLGVAALASGVLLRSGPIVARVWLGVIGVSFMLAMGAMALEKATTEISADSERIRKTNAFGWAEARWEQVARLERVEVTQKETRTFGVMRMDLGTLAHTESYVFRQHNNRALLRMSIQMVPAGQMRQLLDLCRKKTGTEISKKDLSAWAP